MHLLDTSSTSATSDLDTCSEDNLQLAIYTLNETAKGYNLNE